MKYYTALRFTDRPDLHMTLHYMGEIDPAELCALVECKIRQYEPFGFDLDCTHEAYFGNGRTTRVLLANPPLPTWVRQFTPTAWQPHVTCDDPELHLTVCEIAVMSKKQVLRSWELP